MEESEAETETNFLWSGESEGWRELKDEEIDVNKEEEEEEEEREEDSFSELNDNRTTSAIEHTI